MEPPTKTIRVTKDNVGTIFPNTSTSLPPRVQMHGLGSGVKVVTHPMNPTVITPPSDGSGKNEDWSNLSPDLIDPIDIINTHEQMRNPTYPSPPSRKRKRKGGKTRRTRGKKRRTRGKKRRTHGKKRRTRGKKHHRRSRR